MTNTSSPVVRLLLTMDCERVPASEFYPSGPRSWAESERNIRAFAEVAAEHGVSATFFAVPESIEAHVELFRELIRDGHEVGLHLHPHTFRYGVNEYLGNLPADRQRALLAEARDAFASALGFAPTSFRPGHFSASGDTFAVLSQLGFRRTSAVIPGRWRAGTGSDWRGWERGCQYIGDLFEAPVSVGEVKPGVMAAYRLRHATALAVRGCTTDAIRAGLALARAGVRGPSLTMDLRIEEGTAGLLNAIVDGEIPRQLAAARLPTITALTHSYINFSERDDRAGDHGMSRRAHLQEMLRRMMSREDCVVQSRTLTALHHEFDAASVAA